MKTCLIYLKKTDYIKKLNNDTCYTTSSDVFFGYPSTPRSSFSNSLVDPNIESIYTYLFEVHGNELISLGVILLIVMISSIIILFSEKF